MFSTDAFVDTMLATKYGDFNVRVYNDDSKETIVLWKGKFRKNVPPLVRVHSECITGDMLGSLKCDCGKQLQKSLQMIQEKGGIVIYLRQEGRGIGLFEKMKAYNLQAKGYDTFQANVLLGHRPDERTYEMVKTVLDDLGIKKIQLITNNPSKVSEIAKYGFEITERVPLIIKSNPHNRGYFKAKKEKFQHVFGRETEGYYYQFPADSPQIVHKVGEMLSGKKCDPLMNIFVGISANHKTLSDASDIRELQQIFKACESYSYLTPVLHFSFRNSLDFENEIEEIKRTLPFVNNIQLNDLPEIRYSYLKTAKELFRVELPISDEEFDIIENKKIQKMVKKGEVSIKLDNSKGQGIKHKKKGLMKQIDTLLRLGINQFALAGGYGPDELELYFYIRRYYRINFSIDSETKLKTNHVVDFEKVKQYLNQLMRFDDPNEDGIEQTRQFLSENTREKWEEVVIEGTKYKIHPKVFHPGFFPSTRWFAKEVSKLISEEKTFCEIGSGSGVVSCYVALHHPNVRVAASDINPFAAENTKLNVDELDLTTQVEIYNGNVFDSLPKDKKFDSIFWALPFGFLDPGTEVGLEEMQVFDPGYKAIRNFFKEGKEHLRTDGRLLIGFSTDLGNSELLLDLAEEYRIKLDILSETILTEKDQVRFQILSGKYE